MMDHLLHPHHHLLLIAKLGHNMASAFLMEMQVFIFALHQRASRECSRAQSLCLFLHSKEYFCLNYNFHYSRMVVSKAKVN